MSGKTILVIDDSATIRKLVDTHLSPEGYQVILAATAEDGVKAAHETRPDLILLDHQLPGTTGYQVCRQLIESPDLQQIPVVVSSTLRKRAYVEYAEMANVVDMLPKPYTEELLRTTVANALDTAAMVVSSQSQGTAVPEVIHELDEPDLAGAFSRFGLREVLDFLNNGRKSGALEVEAEHTRLWFYLDRGRIQGVSASGINGEEVTEIARWLPESLENLAPVLKLTIGGRSCAEIEGFVQLLDRKVLDPRLMAKLLRYQAAMLVRLAFRRGLSGFRFESGRALPPLYENLPLDISLLALLVEGAMHCEASQLPPDAPTNAYVRQAIRGQNLDRAGLAARHMKILNLLSEPRSVEDLAAHLGWQREEVRRVLHGFVLAELVEMKERAAAGQFLVYEPNAGIAHDLRTALADQSDRYDGKVVRDRLALQLVLKRARYDAMVFDVDHEASQQFIRELVASDHPGIKHAKRIALSSQDGHDDDPAYWQETLGFMPDDVLPRPYTAELLFQALDRMLDEEKNGRPSCPAVSPLAPSVTTTNEPVASGVH